MSAETITLGCRLNFAEGEAMAAAAPTGSLIVNSCAVTGEAVRQTRQASRRAHREQPERPIIVTGCAVQLDPESFAAMPEVAEVRVRDDALPALAAAQPNAGHVLKHAALRRCPVFQTKASHSAD